MTIEELRDEYERDLKRILELGELIIGYQDVLDKHNLEVTLIKKGINKDGV
tara:strand:+ start:12147 stop:12299 length:153 start_codon:yes stop_codon:yes gene_type:complete